VCSVGSMCLSLATSIWSTAPGGVTIPLGFLASGVTAGFKSTRKLDLALLLAPEQSVCAGTFTQSSIRASCIDLCQHRLKANADSIRAVLVNSGQANACTGKQGLLDNIKITNALADELSLKPEQILICSTGVIGQVIPVDKLLKSLNPLRENLSKAGANDAAHAILTTDLVTKQIAYECVIGGRLVHIGGMAKGSGMIHPNMATMLSFITCDVALPPDKWQEMINRVVECSFNAITVDGDTSTNDSVIAFASGESLEEEYWGLLEDGLIKLTQYLAKAIARDGEGASCLLEVEVRGTENDFDARQIALTICGSSLVKTAIHGCDPNWGRIIAAVGRSGIFVDQEKISLSIGPYNLVRKGQTLAFNSSDISSYIKDRMEGEYLVDDLVNVSLVVGNGEGRSIAWGCDLSDQYIRINADYTT